MVFLHIDTTNYDKKNTKTNKTPIEELNDAITHDKNVFLLIYMEGCGPCIATRPEWSKIKNVMMDFKKDANIFIVDIDMGLIDKIKITPPKGFPTLRYIKGKKEEDFEDSTVKNKDREVDAFIEWIKLKSGGQNGGIRIRTQNNNKPAKNRRAITRKNKKRSRWSLKYKKSINCRRPRGFSQKQHCKYGRHK